MPNTLSNQVAVRQVVSLEASGKLDSHSVCNESVLKINWNFLFWEVANCYTLDSIISSRVICYIDQSGNHGNQLTELTAA